MEMRSTCFTSTLNARNRTIWRRILFTPWGCSGRVFHRQEDEDRARDDLEQRAETRYRQPRLPRKKYKFHALLAEIHERQGNYPAALDHYKQFHSKKERILFNPVRNIASLRVLDSLASAKDDLERYHRETSALKLEIEQRKRSQETLHALATQDPLTGVLNRRQFQVLAEEKCRA